MDKSRGLVMRRCATLVLAGLTTLGLPGPVLAQAPQTKPAATRTVVVPAHPLDPLTADELRTVVQIVRAHPDVPRDALFPEIVLNEPPKAEVLAFKPGASVPPRGRRRRVRRPADAHLRGDGRLREHGAVTRRR